MKKKEEQFAILWVWDAYERRRTWKSRSRWTAEWIWPEPKPKDEKPPIRPGFILLMVLSGIVGFVAFIGALAEHFAAGFLVTFVIAAAIFVASFKSLRKPKK